jgi:hypothetical protein
MEINYELIIAILSLIIALIAIIIQYREHKKRQIPNYKGAVGENSKTNKAFFDLLFDNVGRIIRLDIYFDDQQNPKIDGDGVFDFSIYANYNDKTEAGIYVRITVRENDDFCYDNRLSSKRLVGSFKVIGTQEPNQGWMTVSMKPVNVESIF